MSKNLEEKCDEINLTRKEIMTDLTKKESDRYVFSGIYYSLATHAKALGFSQDKDYHQYMAKFCEEEYKKCIDNTLLTEKEMKRISLREQLKHIFTAWYLEDSRRNCKIDYDKETYSRQDCLEIVKQLESIYSNHKDSRNPWGHKDHEWLHWVSGMISNLHYVLDNTNEYKNWSAIEEYHDRERPHTPC